MEKKQNVPALRFQGFSGEWSKRTLENMCDIFTDGDWIEANDQSDTGIRLIQTGNIGIAEYIDKPEHKKWISKETFDRLHCTAVLSGDILISRLPDPAGRACIIPELGMEMITAVDCTIVRVAEEYSKEYLVQYLSTHKYFAEVKNCLAGGTRQRISRGNLSVFSIPVPTDKTEQDRIGKFFERLDDSINVKKRKIQKLQQFRQTMLAKLFPREGAAEPELRFRGFSGKWHYCRFGDIANIRRGLTYSPSNLRKSGIRVLRSSNIQEDTFCVREDDVFVEPDAINIPMVKNGDILITAASGSTQLVGKHAVIDGIKGNTVVHGGFMLLASSDYPDFTNALMGASWYRRFIQQFVAGGNGAIGNLNKSDLEEQTVLIPDITEIKQIGNFFKELDRYIFLQQKKLERMQRLKGALLEKMFM